VLCLALLALLSLGFEWEGRLARLNRELDTGDASRRRDVVRLLAGYPTRDVQTTVLRVLEDEDVGVRIEAADVAARLRVREAAPLLVEWLDDPEVGVREAAAGALGRLGDTAHLAQLVRALGDADARVRRAAVGALAALGGREVVVPLLGRLDDDDAQVRIDAAMALGALADERASVPLVGRARDPVPEVRAAVYGALGELRDARGLGPLLQGLRDDDDDARLAAIGALGRLGEGTAIDPLTDRLETEDARTKRALVAALGALAGPGDDGAHALEALVEALSDPDTAGVAADVLVLRAEARSTTDEADDAPQVAGAGASHWSARDAIVEALAAGLDRGLAPAPIARTLVRLAATGSIEVAAAALARAVDARVGTDGSLLRALGLTGAEPVLLRLLEELRATDVPHQTWALDALSAYFDRVAPDGRAADPLLAALGRVPPGLRDEVVALLGRVRARRALPALRPLLESPDDALRLATVRAIGQIRDPEGAHALEPLLDDRDARIRFEAADALARTGDARTAAALTARLEARAPVDRSALAVALGGVLGSLRVAGAPSAERAPGLAALVRAARGDDLGLAARAIDALAVAADPEVVPALVTVAETAAPSLRSAALRALGAIDDPRALAALRAAASAAEPDVALAALGVLGEHGTPEDAALLFDAAANARWPRSAGAAFALARLARRGALATVPAAVSKLCALFASRDVYVRANVASALAALRAGACAEPAVTPLELLRPLHGEVVRLAAARWTAAAAAAGRLAAADASRALTRCVSSDPSEEVARACAATELPPLGEMADAVAYDPSGRTLRPGALLGLRFADGSVLVTRSDANAHVRLDDAPRGVLSLDNPLDTPLDSR
jgi:HEAT repeat protein